MFITTQGFKKLIFQFTTSHGGRPRLLESDRLQHVFQFTTSHGGRLLSIESIDGKYIFQFTTSHGGRQFWIAENRRKL